MSLSKFNLPELSIIIHYRRDSEDREFNLNTIIRYLDDHFILCDLTIVNDDKEYDKKLKGLKTIYNYVKILYCENSDEFMKSYCFNQGAEHSNGKILAFWDVDVMIDPKHIQTAYDLIEEGKFDHIYPFNGTFIDVQKPLFLQLQEYNFTELVNLWKIKDDDLHFASDSSPGGCNLISREAFERMRGYDDRFIGWGFEDTDFRERSNRVNRIKTIKSDDAICWHLHHEEAKRMENPHFHRNMQIYNENTLK